MRFCALLIFDAAHRASAPPVVAAHIGTIAAEEQVPRAATIHGTRPIAAEVAYIGKRTIGDVAAAGKGQF